MAGRGLLAEDNWPDTAVGRVSAHGYTSKELGASRPGI